MADLENLLLQAAGRKRPSPRQLSRRQEGSYSDDGSDSKDDSDDPVFSSRKPSGSHVPLKKRLDPTEQDDDRSSHGGYSEDDDHGSHSGHDSDSMSSIGSDLYKDDADREALAKMSELEREMILSERADKKNDQQLKKKVRGASSVSEKKTVRLRKDSPPLATRGRSSATKSSKKDALNELRAKRMKQDLEGRRRIRDSVSSGAGGGRGSPFQRKVAGASSDSSGSESGSDSGDEGSGGELGDSEDDVPKSEIKFEHVKNITIRRSRLLKWFLEPFFEELIVGCFVRLGIGTTRTGQSVYRLCIVRNVDASDLDRQYKFENRRTHKYLNLVWGNENSAARWQMSQISDSPPLEKEFEEWKREVERSGGRMPSLWDFQDKKQAIDNVQHFKYDSSTVKQMLQEKKSSSKPFNVAAEKDRLRREIDIAQMRQDDAEVERIRARLQELEASRQAKYSDSKAVRLAEMNRKNREENFKNASELKPVNTALKAGEAGYDPFSRRWTRSRNYYVSTPGSDGVVVAMNGVAAVTEVGNASNGMASCSSEAGVAATVAALEAAAGAGKLVDTNAPVDKGTEFNSLHNFELPITLAGLQKFGGPHGAHLGFMARKQKIEATIGYRVPETDGRRHALTLTVSDYKRRRGLL